MEQPPQNKKEEPQVKNDVTYNVMPQAASAVNLAETGNISTSASVDYKASTSRKWIYVTIALVVLLAAGGVVYYMLGSSKASSNEPTTRLPRNWMTTYFNADSCVDQNVCGEAADPDTDGLGNYDEFKAGTSPLDPDHDNDEIADGDEMKIYKTDPTEMFTDSRPEVVFNNWTDGIQIKNGYDPLTPAVKFTDVRKKQIADDTEKYKLHEPSITTLGTNDTITPSPSPSSSIVPADWKTYSNDKYGFELDYPTDWKVITPDTASANSGVIVSFRSPQTEAALKSNSIDPGYSYDLVVWYWKDISNPNVAGGTYSGQPVYKNLADIMNDKNALTHATAEITVNGVKAYKVSICGHGCNQGVMFERNGIYQLSFETNTTNSDVISSSFRFTK